jgi:hypothetical protein
LASAPVSGAECRAGPDDRRRPEDLGRPQDGAHVVGIGHPVEQHERPALDRDILEPPPVERLRLQRRPLVHGAGIERRGEVARIGDLRRDPSGGDRLLSQSVGGVLRQDQPQLLAPRIDERVPHRMQPEEPDRLGRRGAARALLVDYPGGFLRTFGGHGRILSVSAALDARNSPRAQGRPAPSAPRPAASGRARAPGFSC